MSTLVSDDDRQTDDRIYYHIASGVRLILSALAVVFCVLMFAASAGLTDEEITAILRAIL